MARTIAKLTARSVATITKKGRYADGGGLYLVVSEGGSKAWVFRWMRYGKAHEMGLGSTALPLAEARKKAQGCRELLQKGEEPWKIRKPKDLPSFREYSKTLLEGRKSGISISYFKKWKRQLSYVCGVKV